MEHAPKISLGVPVYNGEKYLARTLDSLLGQDRGDFELILSDNGSTDASYSICEDYARRDSRIKVFRNSRNMGAAYNYNLVFRKSRGEYFKWAPADDLARPTLLSSCAKILDERPDVVLAYPRTEIIDAEGKHERFYEDRLHLMEDDPIVRFQAAAKRMRMCNAVCGLIRSEALARTRLIGTYVGSDAVLLLDLALHGKFFEVPEALYCRRIHEGAYTADSTVEGMKQFLTARSKAGWPPDSLLVLREHLRLVPHPSLTLRQRGSLFLVIARVALDMRHRIWKDLQTGSRRTLRPKGEQGRVAS